MPGAFHHRPRDLGRAQRLQSKAEYPMHHDASPDIPAAAGMRRPGLGRLGFQRVRWVYFPRLPTRVSELGLVPVSVRGVRAIILSVFLDAGRLRADLPVDDFFHRSDLPPEAAQFLKGELPWT